MLGAAGEKRGTGMPSLAMIAKMPHGPDRDDQLRSLLNLLRGERADQEYQREVLSTAEGRESARLRDRASIPCGG
jgi:hypothetical protein